MKTYIDAQTDQCWAIKQSRSIRRRFWVRLFASISLVGLLWASGGQWVAAQPKPQSTSAVAAPDDKAPIQTRYPVSRHWRELQSDRDYQYGNDAPPPENPIARFFYWLYRKFTQFLSSESYQNVWQYVLLAAIAAFVIYLLTKAEVLGFLFSKKGQASRLDYENIAENIHEIDFDAVVDEAVRARNFRLAVRLLYLQTLKRLTDSGTIVYQPDKTNRQYVYELTSSPLQNDFAMLTRQFEFVWYGDFAIDESKFGALQKQFREFGGLLLPKTAHSTL